MKTHLPRMMEAMLQLAEIAPQFGLLGQSSDVFIGSPKDFRYEGTFEDHLVL